MRIGLGYDIHRLVPGRRMMIGGVEIPYETGPLGHSDGDALLHALCDALLGGAGLGDIGEHFPDTDAKYKDAASERFVTEAVELVTKKGYAIGNVDADVFLEKPKLGEWKKKIRGNIARMLGVATDRVSVKAKTMEGLGEIGQEKAYAANVGVVLLEEQDIKHSETL